MLELLLAQLDVEPDRSSSTFQTAPLHAWMYRVLSWGCRPARSLAIHDSAYYNVIIGDGSKWRLPRVSLKFGISGFKFMQHNDEHLPRGRHN
jgi:hypothetical protein